MIEWQETQFGTWVGTADRIPLFVISPTHYKGLDVVAHGMSTDLPDMKNRVAGVKYATVEEAKDAAQKVLDEFIWRLTRVRQA